MKTKLRPTNRKEKSIMRFKRSLITLAIVSLLTGGLLTSLPTQASAGTLYCNDPNASYLGPFLIGKPSIYSIMFTPRSTAKLQVWHNIGDNKYVQYKYSKFTKYQILKSYGYAWIYAERSTGHGLKEKVLILQIRPDYSNDRWEIIPAVESCEGGIAHIFLAFFYVEDANGNVIDRHSNKLVLQHTWW